jgi:hypothetical protein
MGLNMLSVVSRVRSVLKCALLSGFAVAALTGASTVAQAFVYNSTFNIAVYQGTNPGSSISDPFEQAVAANSGLGGLFDASLLIASGTYTGDLNFCSGSPGCSTSNNDIAAFLGSSSGTLSATLAALAGTQLSTTNFKLTTGFIITPTVGFLGSINGGIAHDDGASLYDGSGTVFESGTPTVDITSNFVGLTSPWTLYYVEANNLPAVLTFNVANDTPLLPTPLPASVWLFGSVLAGSGLFFGRRRKRQSAAAA